MTSAVGRTHEIDRIDGADGADGADDTGRAVRAAPVVHAAPSARARVGLALAIALTVAGYVVVRNRIYPDWQADIDQAWAGAMALRRGVDPYAAVGPAGSVLRWPWPLFYPVTALICALPLTLLSMAASRVVFEGVAAGALAWAVTRRSLAPLPLFASAAFLTAVAAANWEPALLAAALLPGGMALLVAKPNIGLALASALFPAPRRAALLGALIGGALLVASFIVVPGWPATWRAALQGGTHFDAPVLRRGGVLVLVALARWRRAEARLLLGLALVPQTMLLYAALPLFAATGTLAETTLLALLSYIPFAVQVHAIGRVGFTVQTRLTGDWMVWCLYLPCLLMVLRRPHVWSRLGDPAGEARPPATPRPAAIAGTMATEAVGRTTVATGR